MEPKVATLMNLRQTIWQRSRIYIEDGINGKINAVVYVQVHNFTTHRVFRAIIAPRITADSYTPQ